LFILLSITSSPFLNTFSVDTSSYLYHTFSHPRLILALHPHHSPRTREINPQAYSVLHPMSSSSNGTCTSLLAYQRCDTLKSCSNAHRRDAFNEIQRTSRATLTLASRRCFCRRRKSLVLVRTHSRKAHVLLSPFLLSLLLFIVKLDKLTPAAMREDYCDLAQNIERSHASCIRYRHNGEFLAKVRGVAKRPDRFTRFPINPPRQLPPAYIVASNSRHEESICCETHLR